MQAVNDLFRKNVRSFLRDFMGVRGLPAAGENFLRLFLRYFRGGKGSLKGERAF